MKLNPILFMLGIISILLLTTIPKENVNAATGRVASLMQSKGVLHFYDKKTNEKVIIDSADFYYLANQIDEMNAILGR